MLLHVHPTFYDGMHHLLLPLLDLNFIYSHRKPNVLLSPFFHFPTGCTKGIIAVRPTRFAGGHIPPLLDS